MKVIRIGRNSDNDYVINHPSVSGNHAELYVYDNGAMQLVDHSMNGSYVNGKYVHNNTCLVYGNDVFVFPDQKQVHISSLLSVSVPTDTNQERGHNGESSTFVRRRLGFGDALTMYFQKYMEFSGRASREEYWFVVLWNIIFSLIPFVNIIWVFATLIPSLALSVRRLHDVGKSGFLLFLGLIPLVGGIIILIWTVTDSEEGENEYGPSPKYVQQ